MNQQLQQRLQNQLRSGERLLWSGMPRGGIRLQAADVLMIPFSLMWGGFAFYWEYSVLQEETPGFFALWGIPFVVIGAYLILGRFFYDAFRRNRTIYGLTDQRVLIISEFPKSKVESLALTSLAQITCSERGDRSGTLALGPGSGMHSWFAGSGWPGMGKYMPPQLELVENVREVQHRILSAQEDARRGQLTR